MTIENAPEVEFPIVSVRTVYPGASPSEIETQINKKIEDSVAEISEIERVSSWSYENFGFVFIEFKLGSDVNVKSMEVKDKVGQILNELPADAMDPIIAKFNPNHAL